MECGACKSSDADGGVVGVYHERSPQQRQVLSIRCKTVAKWADGSHHHQIITTSLGDLAHIDILGARCFVCTGFEHVMHAIEGCIRMGRSNRS